MKHRSSTELAAAVLQTAIQPVKKSHIMYRTGIYIRRLNPILERLLDRQLIEFDVTTKTFVITDRGKEFLDLYRSMTDGVRFGSAAN